MYKIYINDAPLILCSPEENKELKPGDMDLSFFYTGNKKRLHNVIDMMEKGSNYERFIIHSPKPKRLWKDFKSLHLKIKAGGGIVKNEDGEILTIFRRGSWDLPKGKQDSGESIQECALREVMEECGITMVHVEEKAGKTYHIYRDNGRKVLKTSHWYYMTTHKQKLIPQKKEDITMALWVTKEEFLKNYNMYESIRDLMLNSK